MALAIPVWAAIVTAVVGLLILLVVLITIWYCKRMRTGRRLEEEKAGEDFPPMRRLTVRRGKVVPANSKKTYSGVGSSIFGDRRSHRSRFSSVTDVERAESHRSRSPFGIWPSSSYKQQNGSSNELSADKGKRASTREGNMEFLQDVDRQFLNQLSPVSESGRKSRLSERSASIPSIYNAHQLADDVQTRRPPTSGTNTEIIEEADEHELEPESPGFGTSPEALLGQGNKSQESVARPAASVSRLSLSSSLSVPRSKYSSSRLFYNNQRSQSPALPSPLSTSYSALPSFPKQSTSSLPLTPKSAPPTSTTYRQAKESRQTKETSQAKEKHNKQSKDKLIAQTTELTPSPASTAIRRTSGISPKSPSPYGQVDTVITGPESQKSKSRSKSRSPARSRSRSRMKSSLDAPRRSGSRSKSRGRSPQRVDADLDTLPTMYPEPQPYSPFIGAATSSSSLAATAGTTAIPSPVFPSIQKDKKLPTIPTLVPERPGDDIVMGVARSQSKKGRVLRKQSRNSLRPARKTKDNEGVDHEEEIPS